MSEAVGGSKTSQFACKQAALSQGNHSRGNLPLEVFNIDHIFWGGHRAHVVECIMKSQLTGNNPAGAEAALSLQEELVAAIHGAFEVAVEIAVREVKKLVGQATADNYEEMRRENESLKERLQRAEAMLDSARMEGRGGSPPPSKQPFSATKHTDQQLHLNFNPISPSTKVGIVHSCTWDKGDAPSASHSRAQRRPEPQDKLMSRNEEQRSGHAGKTQYVRAAAAAAAEPQKERDKGCTKGM